MVLVPSIRFPTPWANCPNSLASDWYQVVLLGPAIRWQIFLKSTNGGVNDGIGLETVVESGYIGVSGADECWLLMAAVAERVPYSVGRDDMWRPGQGRILRLREGVPGTSLQGGSG